MDIRDCGKTLSKASDEKHTFDRVEVQPEGYLDGHITATCTVCGEVVKEVGKASAHKPAVKDNAYQIASAENLKWYQANLAASLVSGRDALVLIADIDLKNEAFAPIGTEKRPFSGNFNGAGHKISGLKVDSDAEGGLFGVLSIGTVISMLELEAPNVKAALSAGALFGDVKSGAIVKIEWIVVNGAKIESTTKNAGGIGGSSEKAASVALSQCVVDKAEIKGAIYAGGLVGYGNNSELLNCYSNAELTAKNQASIGSLAYYNGSFSHKYSGYVKNASYGKSAGTQYKAEAFATGAIANLVNTYANKKLMGTDGEKTVLGTPVYAVYYGEEKAYTTALLADTGDIELYTDGKTVAIAVKRESGPRLSDLALKVTAGGKTVELKVSDLTLTRRVTLNGKLYTVEAGTALYTVSLEGATAYTIGTISGNTVTK